MVAPAERSPAATVSRSSASCARIVGCVRPGAGERRASGDGVLARGRLRDASWSAKRAWVLTWVARAHDAAWSGYSRSRMLSDRDALDELTPAERDC